MGLFDKLKSGLKKTGESFSRSINRTFAAFGKVDEDFFEELEENLIMADVGVETAAEILQGLRRRTAEKRVTETNGVRDLLRDEIVEKLSVENKSIYDIQSKPHVMIVIGVNGVGKTTTIGKLANHFRLKGKKVLLAAADTFRAGAIEQLSIWADRSGAQLVKHGEGADPASVVFDAISASKARDIDVLICDTAGRLHNKKNLMDELAKISRIIDREIPNAHKEVILVLDSTTGQNAVLQAKTFNDIIGLTGIVLTKLDGTAKGGIIISIVSQLGIPIKLVGVGEGLDDLQEFDAETFVSALLDYERSDLN